jgi:hypothetical protein
VYRGGMPYPKSVYKPVGIMSSRLTNRFAYRITDKMFARTGFNSYEPIQVIRFKLAFQGFKNGSSSIGD